MERWLRQGFGLSFRPADELGNTRHLLHLYASLKERLILPLDSQTRLSQSPASPVRDQAPALHASRSSQSAYSSLSVLCLWLATSGTPPLAVLSTCPRLIAL